MWGSPIFKHDDLPPAPVRANHGEEVLMGLLIPDIGNQEEDGPRADIEDPMQDALSMTARNRHADLGAPPPVAPIQRRSFGDNGFIQHQDDRPRARPQPP